MSTVFTKGPRDQGSILGRFLPNTQKMVLDTSLLHTQHCKILIKGKVKQSRERSNAVPYTSVAIEKGASGHSRLWSPTTFLY